MKIKKKEVKREKNKKVIFLIRKNLPLKLELQKYDCYCVKCKKFL